MSLKHPGLVLVLLRIYFILKHFERESTTSLSWCLGYGVWHRVVGGLLLISSTSIESIHIINILYIFI